MGLRWYVEYTTIANPNEPVIAENHFETQYADEPTHPFYNGGLGMQWANIPSNQTLQVIALADDNDLFITGSKLLAHEPNYNEFWHRVMLDGQGQPIGRAIGGRRGGTADEKRVDLATNTLTAVSFPSNQIVAPASERRGAVAMPVQFRAGHAALRG
jgi:hypothetical protein